MPEILATLAPLIARDIEYSRTVVIRQDDANQLPSVFTPIYPQLLAFFKLYSDEYFV